MVLRKKPSTVLKIFLFRAIHGSEYEEEEKHPERRLYDQKSNFVSTEC